MQKASAHNVRKLVLSKVEPAGLEFLRQIGIHGSLDDSGKNIWISDERFLKGKKPGGYFMPGAVYGYNKEEEWKWLNGMGLETRMNAYKCIAFEYDPIVKPDWATMKMEDRIRLKNDISGAAKKVADLIPGAWACYSGDPTKSNNKGFHVFVTLDKPVSKAQRDEVLDAVSNIAGTIKHGNSTFALDGSAGRIFRIPDYISTDVSQNVIVGGTQQKYEDVIKSLSDKLEDGDGFCEFQMSAVTVRSRSTGSSKNMTQEEIDNVEAQGVPDGKKCLCPRHNDNNPSAIVSRYPDGTLKGVYCFHDNEMMWACSSNTEVKHANNKKESNKYSTNKCIINGDGRIDEDWFGNTVVGLAKEYTQTLKTKMLFIPAGLGTGKTHRNLDAAPVLKKLKGIKTIEYMVPLRSLISSVLYRSMNFCDDWRMVCADDHMAELSDSPIIDRCVSSSTYRENPEKYNMIITPTITSLMLENSPDILILDELEQTLEHVMSTKLGIDGVMHKMGSVVDKILSAGLVIATEATPGPRTRELLKFISSTGRADVIFAEPTSKNPHPTVDKVYVVGVQQKEMLETISNEIIKYLRENEGSKIGVISDSAKKLRELEKIINMYGYSVQKCIGSSSRKEKEDVANGILWGDVILVSPTAATGVSIDEQVDHVIEFSSPGMDDNIVPATTIVQMAGRFRNVKSGMVKCFCVNNNKNIQNITRPSDKIVDEMINNGEFDNMDRMINFNRNITMAVRKQMEYEKSYRFDSIVHAFRDAGFDVTPMSSKRKASMEDKEDAKTAREAANKEEIAKYISASVEDKNKYGSGKKAIIRDLCIDESELTEDMVSEYMAGMHSKKNKYILASESKANLLAKDKERCKRDGYSAKANSDRIVQSRKIISMLEASINMEPGDKISGKKPELLGRESKTIRINKAKFMEVMSNIPGAEGRNVAVDIFQDFANSHMRNRKVSYKSARAISGTVIKNICSYFGLEVKNIRGRSASWEINNSRILDWCAGDHISIDAENAPTVLDPNGFAELIDVTWCRSCTKTSKHARSTSGLMDISMFGVDRAQKHQNMHDRHQV